VSYRDTISAAGSAATAAARAAPALDVTWCPGWRVADVVRHLGRVHARVTITVRERAREFVPFDRVTGVPDAGSDELAGWADERREELLSSLAAIGADTPVWTWYPPQQNGAFWQRRMTHETALHAWDATAAADSPHPIEVDVAVDGVEEFLDVVLPTRAGGIDGSGRTVHLHRTDGPGEWFVAFADGAGVSVERTHAKGDLAVRGPAPDLLRWLANRPSSVELLGAEDVATWWAATVKF